MKAHLLCVILLALTGKPASAATQCTCPKILASGEGNTGCSASEASGRCTVDYNVFSEREKRAIGFLERARVSLNFRPEPEKNIFEVWSQLQGRRTEDTIDTILIYLTVALSAQENTSNLDGVAQQLSETLKSRSVSEQIVQAFEKPSLDQADDRLRERPPENRSLERLSRVNGRIVRGCVEFYVGDVWVMFKAAWSPYRLMPRCGK